MDKKRAQIINQLMALKSKPQTKENKLKIQKLQQQFNNLN